MTLRKKLAVALCTARRMQRELVAAGFDAAAQALLLRALPLLRAVRSELRSTVALVLLGAAFLLRLGAAYQREGT